MTSASRESYTDTFSAPVTASGRKNKQLKPALCHTVVGGCTLRENRDVSGVIRDHGLVVVVQQMPGVELVTTSHDRVGNLSGVIEGGGQTADLTANHDQLLGEKSGHEGARLVSHTEDLDVVQILPSRNLVVKSLPDVLTDTAVNCPGKTTVRGQSHEQLLRLGGIRLYLNKRETSTSGCQSVSQVLPRQFYKRPEQLLPEVWLPSDLSQPWQTWLRTPSSLTV